MGDEIEKAGKTSRMTPSDYNLRARVEDRGQGGEVGKGYGRRPLMQATPEIIAEAERRLAESFRSFSVAGLRWDYLCNVSERTRELIRAELLRRGVSMDKFERMGRGRVEDRW